MGRRPRRLLAKVLWFKCRNAKATWSTERISWSCTTSWTGHCFLLRWLVELAGVWVSTCIGFLRTETVEAPRGLVIGFQALLWLSPFTGTVRNNWCSYCSYCTSVWVVTLTLSRSPSSRDLHLRHEAYQTVSMVPRGHSTPKLSQSSAMVPGPKSKHTPELLLCIWML